MRSSTGASKLAIRTLALLICVNAGTASIGASGGHIATLDERIQGSQRVVVASARTINARWSENTFGDRLIVSRVMLDIEETIKGAAPSNVIWMDIEGGTLDGYTLRVSDLPTIQPGERAVFFLDQSEGGIATPHLRGQGILKLNDENVVRGSSLRLQDIRSAAQRRR